VSAVVPPGEPTVRLVKNVRLDAGASKRVVVACAAGERLVAAYDARGFYTATPPTQQMASALTTTRTISGNRIVVTARSGAANAVVQVSAVCAGGK
jgi:hypothetical protein